VALSSVAANIAASKGILVISSAGNEGNDPWKYITAPGDAEHVITVGAVTADSSYAFFSSVGPNAAGQIKPNVAALGVSTSLIGSYGDISSSNGTSFATPIIAGLTACLWQSRPWSTNLQVKKALEQSSHQSSNPDSLLGYGIPDFFKAYMLLDTVTEKIEKQDSLHVYPNPFNDELMIQYPPIEEHTIIIELYNLYGNKFIIKKITPNPSGQFNLKSSGIKNLSSGIYILKIKTRDDTIMQKIIKHP
jgi:serine protease AprX